MDLISILTGHCDANSSLSILSGVVCVLISLLLGFATSFVYMKTHKKSGYAPNLPSTFIILPGVISTIITLVGTNTAAALSVAGAFAIVRFRTTLTDTKDLSYIFFSLAIGLGCGMGYASWLFVLFTVIAAIIILAVFAVLDVTDFSHPKSRALVLKVMVPEDLGFDGFLDDVLKQYTEFYSLNKITTRDFGATYEMVYHIMLANAQDKKALMDAVRTRNGNMQVSLTIGEYNNKTDK